MKSYTTCEACGEQTSKNFSFCQKCGKELRFGEETESDPISEEELYLTDQNCWVCERIVEPGSEYFPHYCSDECWNYDPNQKTREALAASIVDQKRIHWLADIIGQERFENYKPVLGIIGILAGGILGFLIGMAVRGTELEGIFLALIIGFIGALFGWLLLTQEGVIL